MAGGHLNRRMRGNMEFRDLKKQYSLLKNDIDEGIHNVISNTNFISGSQVKELEEELAAYTQTEYCISCANGTDALTLALMAYGIGPGDAVFVPDFTFFATGEVVSFVGAVPVFIDVDSQTFNIDVAKLDKTIQKTFQESHLTPKAIISVDLFGQPADYPQIKIIAEKYNLRLLEDAAQGFGGKIGDKKACSFGDIATTSFFPAKPLGCYGDGGAIFTNDKGTAEIIDSLRIHGKGTFKYDNVRVGMNSRLDTLQAAILLPKLKAFQEYELEYVNKLAAYYTEALSAYVKTPFVKNGYYSSWAQYTIQLESSTQRDGLQAHLKAINIPSMIYYPKPMHQQTAFSNLPYCEDTLCTTLKLCETVLSLPMHPYLEKSEIDNIITEIIYYITK